MTADESKSSLQTEQDTSAAEPPRVLVERSGALVSLVLNRPKVLNAFDDSMRRVISDEIPKIARNPDIYIVSFSSTNPKAFCAGGDIRALTEQHKTDPELVRSYFRGEYGMNWLLECFSKPTVSLIDGICMGSGAGLTLYNTHRVAGENYKFAMPETAIGLFPDVGVAHPLARLPWPVGLYLGLTGRMVERSDAHWLGLATHCIARSEFDKIKTALANAEPVDPLLDGLHQEQDAGPLQKEFPFIKEYFSANSLSGIVKNLKSAKGESAEWAATTLAKLEKRSPMSLVITDRHIRECRSFDLRQTLIQDYRLAIRCLDAPDFSEGVRAAIIDKDGMPAWTPATLAEIANKDVQSYFAPLGDQDLKLSTREEMQAMRV